MNVNLLELVQECLGPDVVSQLSGGLGQNREQMQAAIGSAIPALIGGLVHKVSSTSGADELMRALESQDAGMIRKLPELLQGQSLDSLIAQGSSLVKLIFGTNASAVIELLSRTLGWGGKPTNSLLAILAPILMGVLKQQRSSMGLDVSGLVKLLLGQQDFLRGKLPGGLGQMLGLGLSAGTPGPPTASPAASSLISRLLPLFALVALAVITWQLFNKRPDTNQDTEFESPTQNVDSMLKTSSGDMELQGPPRDDSFNSN